MNESTFGRHFSELRAKHNITREELSELLNAPVSQIERWENGEEEPGIDMLRKISVALSVTMDDLFRETPAHKQVHKIVITGGPCAGKTTAMSWIQNAFTQRGYLVFFVSETATELMSAGAALRLVSSWKDFQYCLLKLQLDKEKAFENIAQHMKNDKVLIVCDRAALDNRAYMTEMEFRYVMDKLQTDEVSLRDGYDAVFHLVTAAKGAEEYYTLENNASRYETVEQAISIDDKIIAAWTGHPHLRIIDNTTEFEEKMRRLIAEIDSFLGEPEPLEIERKYLIEMPDLKALEKLPNCQRVEIIQTYIRSNVPGDEVRIRQRGCDGHYIYFKTTKRNLEGAKRVELEERLSRDEYLDLLLQADPNYRSIQKTRYCLSENKMYFEIDVYPDWKDQAIMEVELHSEGQEVILPSLIRVIREVTGERAFTNHSLAKIN